MRKVLLVLSLFSTFSVAEQKFDQWPPTDPKWKATYEEATTKCEAGRTMGCYSLARLHTDRLDIPLEARVKEALKIFGRACDLGGSPGCFDALYISLALKDYSAAADWAEKWCKIQKDSTCGTKGLVLKCQGGNVRTCDNLASSFPPYLKEFKSN